MNVTDVPTSQNMEVSPEMMTESDITTRSRRKSTGQTQQHPSQSILASANDQMQRIRDFTVAQTPIATPGGGSSDAVMIAKSTRKTQPLIVLPRDMGSLCTAADTLKHPELSGV